MAVELVTGYQGKDHVTAEQWADFNRSYFAGRQPNGNGNPDCKPDYGKRRSGRI